MIKEVLLDNANIKNNRFTINDIDFICRSVGTTGSAMTEQTVIFELIKKLRELRGLKNKGYFFTQLAKELGVISETKSIGVLDCYQSVEELEELISDIFQTRFLRITDVEKGQHLRKKNGVFHTPYKVAYLIAKEAFTPFENKINFILAGKAKTTEKKRLYQEFINLKVIDPACGTGIILSATIDLLRVTNQKLKKSLVDLDGYLPDQAFLNHVVTKNIYGVDINSGASAIARAILNAKYLGEYKNLTSNICCGNSLTLEGLFTDNSFSFNKQFSDVFVGNQGFDILVMNPPYERLKTDKSNFSKIDDGDNFYKGEKQETVDFVRAVRHSGQYPLAGTGVLDLYKLFIDKAIQIVKNDGAIAFIVPISLLGDVSCSRLRKYILSNTRITNIYCIPENARVFQNVSQAFCIMGMQKGKNYEPFPLYEKVNNIDPLRYARRIEIDIKDIKAICPETLSIPISDQRGWELLRRTHKHPRLRNLSDIINLRGELDLTLGKKYIKNDSSKEMLIRGNMIRPYMLDVDKENDISYVDLQDLLGSGVLGSKTKYINSNRLVGQQIANMGLKKRLRFAFCAKGVVGNSCNFITSGNQDKFNLHFLLGLFNSLLLNWRFKLTSTNNHVNNYEIDDLPIVAVNSKNLSLVRKIADLVKEQCDNFCEDRQKSVDALVFLMYGLNLEDVQYLVGLEIGSDSVRQYLEIYRHEKTNI